MSQIHNVTHVPVHSPLSGFVELLLERRSDPKPGTAFAIRRRGDQNLFRRKASRHVETKRQSHHCGSSCAASIAAWSRRYSAAVCAARCLPSTVWALKLSPNFTALWTLPSHCIDQSFSKTSIRPQKILAPSPKSALSNFVPKPLPTYGIIAINSLGPVLHN
jgi:hypothetical protein